MSDFRNSVTAPDFAAPGRRLCFYSDVMRRQLFLLLAFALFALAGACGQPAVPAHPTWADVSPIIQGECSSCHSSTASQTGGGFRLDFYDLPPEICGDAALALRQGTILAASSLESMRTSITPAATGERARMPPAPGPVLPVWEQDILQRWLAQPVKGPAPVGNRPPLLEVSRLPAEVDGRLSFTAIVRDPDGDSAAGVIRIGDVLFQMNRSGAFGVDLDVSAWPAGRIELDAVLCDGWARANVVLGPVRIIH